MSKIVLFQAFPSSISTQFCSIRSIDRALSGVTTRVQSGSRSYGNEGVLRIPQSSSITGTSPSDCLVSYLGHSLERGLTSLRRYSHCILQPQPIGIPVGGVLPLCNEAVCVVYSPSRLDHSMGNLNPLLRCSQCILHPQPTGPLVGGVYTSAEMQSVYSTAPAD